MYSQRLLKCTPIKCTSKNNMKRVIQVYLVNVGIFTAINETAHSVHDNTTNNTRYTNTM